MVNWSQLDPAIVAADCHHIVHPWTNNCLLNGMFTFCRTAVGTSIFNGFYYPYGYLQNYARHAGDPSERSVDLKEYAKMFFKSTILFAALGSSSSILMSCALRRILGRFTRLGAIFIPGAVGGLTIFFQDEKTRLLFSTYFVNFAMSFMWTVLQETGSSKLTLKQKTFIFMAFSSAISGLLKRLERDAPKYRFFWFYHPTHNENVNSQTCYHDKSCMHHILSSTKNYVRTGLILSALKMSFKIGVRPRELLRALLHKDAYMPAAFFGLYSLIFQGTRCGLCKMAGESTIGHNLFAGALAGLAFIFQPSTTLFNTAPITLVQILFRLAQERNCIPNLPYVELAFALANGIVYEAVMLFPSQCPRIASFLINTGTMKHAHDISEWIKLRVNCNGISVPSGKI